MKRCVAYQKAAALSRACINVAKAHQRCTAINTEWLEVPLDVSFLATSPLLSAHVLSWAARFTRSSRADVPLKDPIEVCGFPIPTNIYH